MPRERDRYAADGKDAAGGDAELSMCDNQTVGDRALLRGKTETAAEGDRMKPERPVVAVVDGLQDATNGIVVGDTATGWDKSAATLFANLTPKLSGCAGRDD